MKCPQSNVNHQLTECGEDTDFGDCLKEHCAWWDNAGVRCGLMSLVERLGYVDRTLSTIAKELTLLRSK